MKLYFKGNKDNIQNTKSNDNIVFNWLKLQNTYIVVKTMYTIIICFGVYNNCLSKVSQTHLLNCLLDKILVLFSPSYRPQRLKSSTLRNPYL